jgi:hypothetical protein
LKHKKLNETRYNEYGKLNKKKNNKLIKEKMMKCVKDIS